MKKNVISSPQFFRLTCATQTSLMSVKRISIVTAMAALVSQSQGPVAFLLLCVAIGHIRFHLSNFALCPTKTVVGCVSCQ